MLQCAIVGSSSAPKVHEIVAARGQVLELLRPDESGRVQVVHSTQVFGLIRSLAPFRCGPGFSLCACGRRCCAWLAVGCWCPARAHPCYRAGWQLLAAPLPPPPLHSLCRFPGSQQDYVICGSDSGRVVILQYSNDKNCFQKVHQETYGKSGCRYTCGRAHTCARAETV